MSTNFIVIVSLLIVKGRFPASILFTSLADSGGSKFARNASGFDCPVGPEVRHLAQMVPRCNYDGQQLLWLRPV
jgi:hypothetical protein